MARVDKPLREEAAGARCYLWGKSAVGFVFDCHGRTGLGVQAGRLRVLPEDLPRMDVLLRRSRGLSGRCRRGGLAGIAAATGLGWTGWTGFRSCGLPPWWSTRPWKLPAPEGLDDAHPPAAVGAWLPQCHRDDIGGGCVLLHCWLRAEQRAGPGKVAFAGCAGQQAVVTNAVEPAWEHMDEEPAQELVRIKPHDLHTVSTFDPAVFPAEHHGSGISADRAAVGDGNPMRVAAEVCQYGFGSAEGRFGIDHPFGLAKRRKPGGKCINVCQPGQIAEEGELSRPMQRDQTFDEQPTEQSGQHPDMQEEPRLAANPTDAILREPASWYDHVDVGMVRHCRSPGVEHTGHTDAGTHTPGIGGDGRHRLCRCFEQQAVDGLFVPKSDPGDLGWQGEDQMEILHRQQIICPRRHPVTRGWSLALRAMPVFATVVCDVLVIAFGASRHMPAERFRPASLNG